MASSSQRDAGISILESASLARGPRLRLQEHLGLQEYLETALQPNNNNCREALKGRPEMQLSPNASSAPPGSMPRDAQVSNLIYQCMTIAAMLLLLASLWLF